MEKALAATTKTQLAYVVTGNAELDETSRAGLEGLSMYLADRTALEPGEPAPVDVAADELAFYALIYWPIDPDQPVPRRRPWPSVDTFLKNGGTILFDTRDAGGFSGSDFGGNTPENQKLRDILAFVDVPPLEPVPPDHVLTKAFYLLSNFPGRWENSDLWVESLSDAPEDPEPAGARRRRGVADPHHRQRSCLRLGGRQRRALALPDRSRRSAPARPRLPLRRQHRHVCADRQLQGRPGARAGAA